MEWFSDICKAQDGSNREGVFVKWEAAKKALGRKYNGTLNDDILLVQKILASNLPEHIVKHIAYNTKTTESSKTLEFISDNKEETVKTKKITFYNEQTNHMFMIALLIDEWGWTIIGPIAKTADDLVRILNYGRYIDDWEDIIYHFNIDFNASVNDVVVLSDGSGVYCDCDAKWQVLTSL